MTDNKFVKQDITPGYHWLTRVIVNNGNVRIIDDGLVWHNAKSQNNGTIMKEGLWI